jgi:hypothetical protein
MSNLVSKSFRFVYDLILYEYKINKDLLIDDTNRTTTTTTIIKTITFEETAEDNLGGKKATNETTIPQFKQLEPLKMVKRDLSKDFLPSSSSASSVDTIVTVAAMRKSLGL